MNKEIVLHWGDRIVRWAIGLIFLSAAVPKLLNFGEFAAIIDAYGMLADPFVQPAALVLPILEIVLAVGLLFNRLTSKVGAALLLLLFIGVLSYAIWQGLDIDCGCFGPEDPELRAFSGLRTALGRDIVMFSILIYSFWYQRYLQHTF